MSSATLHDGGSVPSNSMSESIWFFNMLSVIVLCCSVWTYGWVILFIAGALFFVSTILLTIWGEENSGACGVSLANSAMVSLIMVPMVFFNPGAIDNIDTGIVVILVSVVPTILLWFTIMYGERHVSKQIRGRVIQGLTGATAMLLLALYLFVPRGALWTVNGAIQYVTSGFVNWSISDRSLEFRALHANYRVINIPEKWEVRLTYRVEDPSKPTTAEWEGLISGFALPENFVLDKTGDPAQDVENHFRKLFPNMTFDAQVSFQPPKPQLITWE